MNRILFGGALGALAMYFLDPQSAASPGADAGPGGPHRKVLNQAGRVDLLRMKSMIETGRAAHDAARPVPSES
jgi:hypothetical protein